LETERKIYVDVGFAIAALTVAAVSRVYSLFGTEDVSSLLAAGTGTRHRSPMP
tara:strand:+ start:186 stop:344 length:159 start_codon:yes stop_codon:yes gene_type:complete